MNDPTDKPPGGDTAPSAAPAQPWWQHRRNQAVAFAVLLMNFAAPFIDYYTLPRTYGHEKSRRATESDNK